MKTMVHTEDFVVGNEYLCTTIRSDTTSAITGLKVAHESLKPQSFYLRLIECDDEDFYCGAMHKHRFDIGFMTEHPYKDEMEWTTRTFTGLAGSFHGTFSGQLLPIGSSIVWSEVVSRYDATGNKVADVEVQTVFASCSLAAPQ